MRVTDENERRLAEEQMQASRNRPTSKEMAALRCSYPYITYVSIELSHNSHYESEITVTISHLMLDKCQISLKETHSFDIFFSLTFVTV
jgi:hypothetical protein